MKKKLLEQIPMKTMKIKTNKKYTVLAEILNLEHDEKILMVDFYYNDSCVSTMQNPKYRLFINEKEDYIYKPNDKSWNQRKIESLPNMSYSLKDSCEPLEDKSKHAINKYIHDRWESDPLYRIRQLQEKNRSNKSERAYELRKARIERNMQLINQIPIPEDLTEFVDKSFYDKRYIFYKSDKNRKYVKLFCSHCKTVSRIEKSLDIKPYHKESGTCAICGSSITYIQPGWKEKCTDKKEFVLMQKIEKGFVSRYFDADKCSSQSGEHYDIWEKARVIYDGKRIWTYYNISGSYNPDRAFWWDKNAGMYSYDTHVYFGRGILYSKNLDEVLMETEFRYCALKQLAEHKIGFEINHENFMMHYESNRFIEYFIKMGLYNLTNDFVNSHYTTSINKTGKSIFEILKLSKQQVKRLIEMDGNIYTLKLLQTETTSGKKFTDDQIMFFTENTLNMDSFGLTLEYTTAGKAIRYMKEQRGYKDISSILLDWRDYIENCKLLNYDLKNEFILFPRHLKEAHDRTSAAVVDLRNEEKNKVLMKIMTEIEEKFKYASEHFIMIFPKSSGDLIREGQTLHHCVGTYIDRVAKGETTILFVRRKDEADEPFYTMEVKDGDIVQCRGKNNCDMTKQVKQFVESFKKNKLKKIKTYTKGGGNVA